MSEATTGALAKALAAAQRAAGAVPHDARNEFHKYQYTSAEAILEAAKGPLADNGLALVPVGATLATRDGVVILCSRSLLLHASGESQAIDREWPVIPDRGRPLDKAVAGALTTGLAYLLRDLLCMPRCDPADDISAREDGPQQQQRPRPQQAAARQTAPTPQGERGAAHQPATGTPHKAPPANGQELLLRLQTYETGLVEDGLCEAGDLVRHVLAAGTRAGWSNSMHNWDANAVKVAPEAVKGFEQERRAERSRLRADLQARIDDATPDMLDALEEEAGREQRRLGREGHEEAVRAVREKRELAAAAKGKTRKAKAG